MPLSDAQYRQLIVDQVGDTASGLIANQITTLWTLNDDQPSPKLQFYHTKRAAIQMLMGAVREQVTQQGLDGVRTDLSKKLEHLATMLTAVNDDIDRYQASGIDVEVDSDFAAAAGELTTTTSRPPPTACGPDANSPLYRGDPYYPRRRR